MRKFIRVAALGAVIAATTLATPQAFARSAPDGERLVAGTGVHLTARGAQNLDTRAVAAADPAAVGAATTLCGSGYKLDNAERLPDARRFGTLFTYTKDVRGAYGVCSVFENNTSGAKHMKLKLCAGLREGGCKADEGTYSQYAGPVKIESGNPMYMNCPPVTAIMWSGSTAIIDRVRSATPCD